MRFAGSLAGALLLLGCADDSASSNDPKPELWVGAVSGTDVLLAIVSTEERRSLFFCGGEHSYERNTRWFAPDEPLDTPFSFSDRGWSVEGELHTDHAEGSVTPEDGELLLWTAQPTAPDTLAGLYEGTGPCGKLGLIVTQARASREPTGQGACLRVEGETTIVEQVNPVMPMELSDGGLRVTVGSSPSELTLHPAVSRAR